MASVSEIEGFLRDFKHKLDFWGLIFRSDRGKNFTTIIQLEYNIADVKKVLRELELGDYAEGPLEETLYNGADMWVFGKWFQAKEVYIKISMGLPSDKAFCISFHFSDRALNYPYKNK